MDFGGCEDEDDGGGRLFERLEQGVERLLREHVDFIDDIHFVAALGGGVADRLAQIADFIHPAVRGPVDLENIEAAPFGNLRSEEHTSELQSPCNLVCRLLLEKKKNISSYA